MVFVALAPLAAADPGVLVLGRISDDRILISRASAPVLLLTERNGVSHCRSVVFVRNDSLVWMVGDLRGHRLALQNPRLTSAYLLPAITLFDAGVPMAILPSPTDRPRSGSVGDLFGNTGANIATWVMKGVVDERVPENAAALDVLSEAARRTREAIE